MNSLLSYKLNGFTKYEEDLHKAWGYISQWIQNFVSLTFILISNLDIIQYGSKFVLSHELYGGIQYN